MVKPYSLRLYYYLFVISSRLILIASGASIHSLSRAATVTLTGPHSVSMMNT